MRCATGYFFLRYLLMVASLVALISHQDSFRYES